MMLHLTWRESNTDAEGATQVNNRNGREGRRRTKFAGGHNFCWARKMMGIFVRSPVNVITRTATSVR